MFGGKNAGNGSQGGQSASGTANAKRMPPLRNYRVRRVDPQNPDAIEVIDVQAHGIEYGTVLAFHLGVEIEGSVITQLCFATSAWIDVTELPIAEPSRLIH